MSYSAEAFVPGNYIEVPCENTGGLFTITYDMAFQITGSHQTWDGPADWDIDGSDIECWTITIVDANGDEVLSIEDGQVPMLQDGSFDEWLARWGLDLDDLADHATDDINPADFHYYGES